MCIFSGDIHVIYAQELVELTRRDGFSNTDKLEKRALTLAQNYIKNRPKFRVNQRLTYFRPLRVNCNGIIQSVRLATRQEGRGCEGGTADNSPCAEGTRCRQLSI